MRVAMIGHKAIPSRAGGVEVVVEELASELVKRGIEVVAYNRYRKDFSLEEYKGIKLRQAFSTKVKNLDAVLSSLFASVSVTREHFDVIHYHATGPALMLIIPKVFSRKSKIVVTIHSMDKLMRKGKIAKLYMSIAERVIVRYADEIIVVSKSLKKYMEDTYGREVIYVPNGVSIRYNKSDDVLRKYGLTKHDYALYVGRIVSIKGIELLLEAFRGIETSKKLVLAGGYDYSSAYFNKIRELVSEDKRVLLLGEVVGDDLWNLYRNSSVFVLPSFSEGMPLSVLEAMYFDCNILTSNIESCSDLVGLDNTFVMGDVDSLKNCLEAKLSGSGYPYDVDVRNYNWVCIANIMMVVYEKGGYKTTYDIEYKTI